MSDTDYLSTTYAPVHPLVELTCELVITPEHEFAPGSRYALLRDQVREMSFHYANADSREVYSLYVEPDPDFVRQSIIRDSVKFLCEITKVIQKNDR